MADITMCQNFSCPSNQECYRYKAAPNPFTQAYSNFQPDEDKCDYFVSMGEDKFGPYYVYEGKM